MLVELLLLQHKRARQIRCNGTFMRREGIVQVLFGKFFTCCCAQDRQKRAIEQWIYKVPRVQAETRRHAGTRLVNHKRRRKTLRFLYENIQIHIFQRFQNKSPKRKHLHTYAAHTYIKQRIYAHALKNMQNLQLLSKKRKIVSRI